MYMAIKAFLFDFDGVIVDTEHYYTEFWVEQGKIYFPELKDFALIIKGRSLKTIYDEYFVNMPQAKIDIEKALIEQEKSMVYNYIDGVENFLSQSKDCVKVALVTSSSQRKMDNVYRELPEIKSKFDVIVTANDISKSKPNPECYQKAAERLGLSVEECIVFEDSIAGVVAGKEAGMKVIGLATTVDKETLSQYADKVIENFVGLKPNYILTESFQ
ncbi:MAG: HAD family phosphatase [Bacteroidales bacterium]|nr:HAD family phosphatase [Bacteroidales bacterium]